MAIFMVENIFGKEVVEEEEEQVKECCRIDGKQACLVISCGIALKCPDVAEFLRE